MSFKRVLAAIAMLSGALPATAAVTIDFEGVGDMQPVGTIQGVEFSSNALAAIDRDAGGNGNFENEPSPSTTMFFFTGSALANVPGGFSGGLSFYYSSEKNAVVNVYDGLNAQGNVVGTILLEPQSNRNCNTANNNDFCNWTKVSVTFNGIARSVDFGGTVNLVGYDNITFGIDTQDIDRRTKIDTCSPCGNPIHPTVGVKRETVDSLLRVGGQPFLLTYDTARRAPTVNGAALPSPAEAAGFGELWLSSLHRKLSLHPSRRAARASRGDGRIVSFTGDGTGIYTADVDINDRLITITGGYRYIDAGARAIETYDSAGKLTSIAYARGRNLNLIYSISGTPAAIAPSPGYLIEVQDSFGRTLRFEYQLQSGAATARVSKIIDSAGQTAVPEYDTSGNLIRVTWADNSVRQFLYELASLPWALTGVVDERAIRKSTFGYDSQGRATSTEYAGGVNRFSVSYANPPQVVVTESFDAAANILFRTHTWDWQSPQGPSITAPNGTASTHDVVSVVGQIRISLRRQPAGSGSAASTSGIQYNAEGNVSWRDDFTGARTCFAYDSLNRETVRVEGLATTANCSTLIPAAAQLPVGSRKISTEWHPDWRLHARRAEPGKRITLVYNGQPDPFNGNALASCAPATALLPDGKPIAALCKQVEQATTDTNGGSAFSAALQTGVANRQTSWTYNAFGQVLTEDGPRTDVNDITTYVYYSDTTADHTIGDLSQVTNPAGQITQYTKYNKHGQVLQMIDPNAGVTAITYDLRQRLISVSVGGQISSYTYDPVGQLTRVTLPDASYIGYDYDGAHRLVAVFDNLRNRVDYTLDNAGHKTGEQVKDPGGTLQRSLSRSIDALGRVQQTTGEE